MNMATKKNKNYTENEILFLCKAFKRSRLTITRWIKANDDRLTSDKAASVLNNITSFRIVFIKNEVYIIGGKKMVCILADDDLSCLCPFEHKMNSGYKIIMKPAIYSTVISNNGLSGVDVIFDGSINGKKYTSAIK